MFAVWGSLLSCWKFARDPQIKKEWRPLLQRKWVLLFICTQVGVLIRICFSHVMCPTMHPALLKHFVSMHDHHPYLFFYSVQGSGAEQPSAATSISMQNSHMSSDGVNIWLLWKLGPSSYLEPNTQNQKPLFKYWQKRNKLLVPNTFQMPLYLSENILHRKCSTFLSPYIL